jgi:CRISPR-associated protein Cmr5
MGTRRTTEQRRAADAWQRIEQVPENLQQKYGSWARRLPALSQVNGLGQALAFLNAKGQNRSDKHQTVLYRHLSNWVCRQMGAEDSDLLRWVMRENSGQYRRATTEALTYALWLRRFAEAQGWGQESDLEED